MVMDRAPAVAATLHRTRGLPVIRAVAAAVPTDREVAVTFPAAPVPQAAEDRLGAEAMVMGDLHPATATAGGAAIGAVTPTVQMIRPARDPRAIGNDVLVRARALGS